MTFFKIMAGVVFFALAALSLVMAGLIALAWTAQYSNRAAGTSISTVSIMIGQWTLSGWQICAAVSLPVMLCVAFIGCGIYVFRSSKPAA
jgi:hypothetical protein